MLSKPRLWRPLDKPQQHVLLDHLELTENVTYAIFSQSCLLPIYIQYGIVNITRQTILLNKSISRGTLTIAKLVSNYCHQNTILVCHVLHRFINNYPSPMNQAGLREQNHVLFLDVCVLKEPQDLG